MSDIEELVELVASIKVTLAELTEACANYLDSNGDKEVAARVRAISDT